MIYFDTLKNAYTFEIENLLCTLADEEWSEFCKLKLGKDYDVTADGLVDLRQTPEYIAEELVNAKSEKQAENTIKAKQTVENGHVVFKNAQFETNAQTVGDLTATMLLMQASGLETYSWLSKDDLAVELTVEDFGTLGGLIAEYKNTIWQEKYIAFKNQIEQAETLAELEEIELEY